MGEANRRGSKPPTSLERARRSAVRLWYLYPKWFRVYYKFNVQIVLVGAGVLALVAVIALGEWLLSR